MVAIFLTIFPVTSLYAESLYYGTTKGADIISAGGFTDISTTTAKDNILKLRVLNIVEGSSGRSFNPKNNITRQEALSYLVKAADKGEDAKKKQEAFEAGTTKPTFSSAVWAVGTVEQALADGLINQTEITKMGELSKAQIAAIDESIKQAAKKNWKITIPEKDALKSQKIQDTQKANKNMQKAATRQELAIWTARAFNTTPVMGNDINKVYKYTDWKNIKAEYIPYVEALLQQGILSGASAAIFSPGASVTRAEAANIIEGAINKYPDKLKLKYGTGRIKSILVDSSISGDSPKYDMTYELEDFDGVVTSIKVRDKENLPVISDGRLLGHHILKEGDTIEYAIRDEKEALYARLGGISFVNGNLSYIDEAGNVRVEDRNNTVSEMKLNDSTLVTVLGKPGDQRALIVGQPVKALYKNGSANSVGAASYIDIQEPMNNAYGNITLEGTIKYIDGEGKTIKIEDYDGNIRLFALADRVGVTINNYTESMDHLVSEQDAVFEVEGRKIVGINAYLNNVSDESVKAFAANGRVRTVKADSIIISPSNDNKNDVTYKLDYLTLVNSMGNQSRLNEIKVGDQVIIKGTAGNKERADQISIVSKRAKIYNIYKAKIMNTLPSENKIALSEVYTYKYTDWVKADEEKTLPLKGEADIYRDGIKIPLNKLDTLKGSEVYLVTTKEFGNEQIAKLTFKSGSEDELYSSSMAVKWADNIIKFDDGGVLKFDDSAIIIKDRRLLDTSDLTYNKEAFVIKNRTRDGSSVVSLLSMENVNAFDQRTIVKGYIHDMGEDYFSLESISTLTNNTWDYENDAEENFYISMDVKIRDHVVQSGFVSKETFLNSRYKPYTYTIHDPKDHMDLDHVHNYNHKSTHGHSHMLAYAIVGENDEVIALNIVRKDNKLGEETITHTENLTSGEVVSANTTYSQLKITEVREYSDFYGNWQVVKNQVTLNTAKAVILKGNQNITLDEIQPGDQIYVVSDQNNALIVFVE